MSSTQKTTSLYLCSTPFNILMALMLAIEYEASEDAHIGFIDQPTSEAYNQLHQQFINQKNKPFKSAVLISKKCSQRGKQKLEQRKQSFQAIEELITKIRPARVFTGNDRRLEFQFAMHYAQTLGLQTKGVYMDDGTYTYMGRQRSWINDKVIDLCLKKMVYGLWWKQPNSIGDSGWINEAYVAFPQHVFHTLKQKPLHQFPNHLHHPWVKDTFAPMIPEQLNSSGQNPVIVTLPHQSAIQQNTKHYIHAITQCIQELSKQGYKVFIKYHPKEIHKDPYQLLKHNNTVLLPNTLPFEMFLTAIKNPIIIGDLSSTLLTSRCLMPNITVMAYMSQSSNKSLIYSKFLKTIQVNVFSNLDTLIQQLRSRPPTMMETVSSQPMKMF